MFALLLGAALAAPTDDGLDEYREARRLAAAGHRVVLVVGDVPAPLGRVYRAARLPKTDPGVYDCFLGEDGQPKMLPAVGPLPRLFDPPIIPYFPVQTILGGS